MPHRYINCFAHGSIAHAAGAALVGAGRPAALSVLNEAYDQLKDLPPNRAALAELEENSESYKFEHFVNA
jgi:hypothetical protein